MLSGALFVAEAAMAGITERQKPVFDPIEPFTDNTTSMYMYNVGAKKFFAAGNDWGTQTSISDEGYRVYFEQYLVDGVWDGTTVIFRDSCLVQSGKRRDVFFDTKSGSCFVDRGSQINFYWKMEKGENGAYRFSMAEMNPNYESWQVAADSWGRTYFGWRADGSDGTRVKAFVPATESTCVDWTFCNVAAYNVYQQELKVFNASETLKEALLSAIEMGLTSTEQEAVYNNAASTIEEIEAAVVELLEKSREKVLEYAAWLDTEGHGDVGQSLLNRSINTDSIDIESTDEVKKEINRLQQLLRHYKIVVNNGPNFIYSKDVTIGDWYFSLDTDYHVARANQYTGYETDVVVPESFIYNGEKYITVALGGSGGCTYNTWQYNNLNGNYHHVKSVKLPATLRLLGVYAMAGLEGVTSVSIPSLVYHIHYGAFSGCTSLTSLNIPEEVNTLGKYAFEYCTSLSEIVLPSVDLLIDDYAFAHCSNLRKIKLSETLTTIGNEVFCGCSSLDSLVIPAKVTSIGSYIFADCYNLRYLRCEAVSPPSCSGPLGADALRIIYVSAGSGASYRSAPYWNDYVIVDSVYTLNEEQTDNQGLTYLLNETKDAFALSGYTADLVADVKVPETLYGLPVNAVQDKALYGAVGLETIFVPASVSQVGTQVFGGCYGLLVLEWDATVSLRAECFDEAEAYGNMLVFTASATDFVGNVVVNGVSEEITLMDGKPFRNPKAFTAKRISYSREFTKKTRIGIAGGWEGLVLPFDVQRIVSKEKGEVQPFGMERANAGLSCWIAEMQEDATFGLVDKISANRPFIMEVPNSDEYKEEFNIEGIVIFTSDDATVHATEVQSATSENGYLFTGAYKSVGATPYVYALNDEEYTGTDGSVFLPGGAFVSDLRDVRPFEAYLYNEQLTRMRYLSINGGMATGIDRILKEENKLVDVYTLQGVMVKRQIPVETLAQELPGGIYIVNGKKMVIR